MEQEFLLQLDDETFTPLREAQSKMLDKGHDLEDVKKAYRKLGPYLEKERQGRKWFIKLNQKGVGYLEESLNAPDPIEITEDGIQLNSKVSRSEWSSLMKQVKTFDLATAFVPRGSVVTVTHEGETYDLEAI